MKAIKSSLQKSMGCCTRAQCSNQDTLLWNNNAVLECGRRISNSSSTVTAQLPYPWGETSYVHILKIKNCSPRRRNTAEVHSKYGTTSRTKRRLFLPHSSQWEKKEIVFFSVLELKCYHARTERRWYLTAGLLSNLCTFFKEERGN